VDLSTSCSKKIVIYRFTSLVVSSMIIAFVNHKGGVGKTTSVVNIGAALAEYHNKRILLVDFDSQANLTTHCGVFEPQHTSYDVLEGTCSAQNAIVHRVPFDVLPASLELGNAEFSLITKTAREILLKRRLADIEAQYDAVLIDCPPSLGILTINALAASNQFYIVTETEFLPFSGLLSIETIVDEIKASVNENLRRAGIIATKFDQRKINHKHILDALHEQYNGHLCTTTIRTNTPLSEASGNGQTIFEYDAKSRGAEDYQALAQEVLERSGI
jgi:chromosome partitioning protein